MTVLPFRKASDQRRFRRLDAKKPALLRLNECERTLDVTITDMSPAGARLAVPAGHELPETFVLVRPAEPGEAEKSVNCQLRWQRGGAAGVTFF